MGLTFAQILTIYTFDAAAGSAGTRLGNTCVVVGGSYKGSSPDTHFYRMDFIKTDNQVSTYLPLLRNHKYTFTIHSVTGPGFPTPEEAFHAGSVNIEAGIIAWNEGGMHHVVFDNQSTLSVSQDRFVFGYGACNSEKEDNVLYIFTDYTNSSLGAVSGWYIEKIVDAATQAPISWLTATPNRGAANNKEKVVLTYQQNNSDSDRYATIWIAAGRLRYPIHITQYKLSQLDVVSDPGYLLDGLQKVLLVKSNVAWKIKSITQEVSDPSKNILSPKPGDKLQTGTTGGDNMIGESIGFTVADDGTFWGKLHITFESTDDPKRFEDKTFTLIFALPRIKITGIGTTGGYGYNPAAAGTSHHCAYNMLTSANNFGLQKNSTVYSHGFLFTAYGAGITNTQIQSACDNSEIIILTYSYVSNTAQANILANYVRNGGVLITFCESPASAANFMNALFNVNNITFGTTNGAGAIYQINPNVDDLVTNGPFGDLRGKHWGEDASATGYIQTSALPADSYTLYSTAANMTNNGGNANYMTSFRLNDYNVLFVGDGGFLSSAQSSGYTVCPFRLDDNYEPITKIFGSSTRFDVYNSAMFGNIMAWALSRVGN